MFRLAHLSDPHLGPLPPVSWVDLASKRIFGFVNWQRRRTRGYTAEIVDALKADLSEKGFDHLAVTGDLVNIGMPEEFRAARGWLAALGQPEDISVVPGNHDVYVSGAFGEMLAAWRPFMSGDEPSAGRLHFPFVRRRGPIGLVGVSSAVPTAPLMATGKIREDQAAALEARLAELGREGLFRVVLIHHPPVSGTTPWHRRLKGAKYFRRAIAEVGAELILYGHNHHTHVGSLPGPDGPVPTIGATSASLRPRFGRPGGSYVIYRIEGRGRRAVVTMTEHGIRREGAPVEVIGERRLTSDQPAGTFTQA